MPYEFRLPDLGEGIAEVELRRWLVKEGDRVAEHQAIVEVETDKAVVEVPSPHEGTVVRIHRQEGETVRVGEVLLEIGGEGDLPLPGSGEHQRSVGIVGVLPEPGEESGVLATPLVRKLARERGIDLKGVHGSGPRGSITPEDLEPVAAPLKPSSEEFGPVERLPLRGVRRTTARNVLASQRLTAFVTTMEEADVTELWQLREREQQAVEARGTHLTFLPFFIKAAQHALREHPSQCRHRRRGGDDHHQEALPFWYRRGDPGRSDGAGRPGSGAKKHPRTGSGDPDPWQESAGADNRLE